LGLLDGWTPSAGGPIDLDSAENRAIARRIAEESIVLLANDGALPLAPDASRRIAIVGPNARADRALFGCYSFENHVLPHHADVASAPR
ncbi:hypothetical protein NL533_32045, partial [Klebsiella pneumoniae]|nr:hypothetical protein [Klebsiella pneumoniae]